MRNKRALALAVALCTVVLTVLVQAAVPRQQEQRYLQHEQMPPQPAGVDGLACIRPTTAGSYDPAAVDVPALQTHLPLLTIDTREQAIPGAPYYAQGLEETQYTLAADGQTTIQASLQVYDSGSLNSLAAKPSLSSEIQIRVRGNSSRWFDKKSYFMRTVDQNGAEKQVPLLGLVKHDNWALHGPFLDKTLLRNYLGMNISGQIMDYAPNVRYCELVVNGEYRGVYLLLETISRDQERVNIRSPQKEKNVTGYIVQFDSDSERSPEALDNFTYYTYVLKQGAQVLVEYPGQRTLTPELRHYVERDFSAIEKALYSYDYDDKQYGYQTNLDLDEFADYFILMEVFEMHDTGNLSTFFYKDVTGKVKPCVWDFNNGSGNYSVETEDDFFIRQFVTVQAPWFWMLCKDEDFTETVISRYHLLRQGPLSDQAFETMIDDTVAYLGPAINRNFAVWGYSFDPANLDFHNKLHPDERNPDSYQAALEQLKTELFHRLHWLDQHIEVLRQYSHESAVKKYNP